MRFDMFKNMQPTDYDMNIVHNLSKINSKLFEYVSDYD